MRPRHGPSPLLATDDIVLAYVVIVVNYTVQDGRSNWLEGMILMCKIVLPSLALVKANQYDRPVSYYCRNVLVLSGKVCAVSTVSSYQRLIIFHHSEITEILERCS